MLSDKDYVRVAVHPESVSAMADISGVLGLLYESPLRDELWKPVLSRLCEITASKSGFLVTGDDRTALAVRAQSADQPDDSSLVAQYNRTYSKSDPFRQPVLQTGCTGVMDDEQLLPNAGLLRTELYRDQLEPRGLRYATFMVTAATTDRIEALSLWRTMSQGPFPEESRGILEFLYPHVQKSMELRHILRATQRRLAGVEAMLDATPTATFLVTKRGHLLYRNAAASALLEEREAINLENDMLVAASNQSRDALRVLLLKTADAHDKTIAVKRLETTIVIQAKSNRQPVYVLARPLETTDRRRTGADVMLLVTDRGNPIPVPHETLQSIFGLPPALADIANGLLAGHSLESIALLRRVSLGTVRQQLKSILSKTGTAKQSDLVRLLLSLPRSVGQK